MKVLNLLTLLILVTNVFSEIEEYRVYSMFWVCKHYPNGKEKQVWAFSVPFTFDTRLNIDWDNKVFHIDFPNARNFLGMYNIVKEQGAKNKDSFFNNFLSFNEKYNKADLDFSKLDNENYMIELIEPVPKNQFQSIRVKFIVPNSKDRKSLYIYFDFQRTYVDNGKVTKFLNFLKQYAGKKLNFLEE